MAPPPAAAAEANAEDLWSTPGPEGGHATNLRFDPFQPRKIYVDTRKGTAWSADAGGRWQDPRWPNVPYVAAAPTHITPDASEPGAFYGWLDGLHRRVGDGPWTKLPTPEGAPAHFYPGGVWSRHDIVYVAYFNPEVATYLFRSADSGQSWHSAGVFPAYHRIPDLFIDPADSLKASLLTRAGDDDLYARTVFETADGGTTWAALDGGRRGAFTSYATSTTGVRYVSEVPKDGNRGTRIRTFRIDSQQWVDLPIEGLPGQPFYNQIHDIEVLRHPCTVEAVDPQDSTRPIVLCQDGRLYGFSESAAAWQRLNALRLPQGAEVVQFDPAVPARLYATGGDIDGSGEGPGVLVSTDGGATWSPSVEGLKGHTVTSMLADPHRANRVYAQTGYGYQQSNDGGLTWRTIYPRLSTDVSDGDALTRRVILLAMSPVDPNVMFAYAGHTDEGGSSTRFFLTTSDGGQTWHRFEADPAMIVSGATGMPEMLVDRTGRLHVGTYDAIWSTDDLGVTWRRASVPANRFVAAPTATGGEILYAWDDDSLFRSTDGGTSWQPFEEGLPRLDNRVWLRDLVSDGAPDGTLYAAADSGGLLYRRVGDSPWQEMPSVERAPNGSGPIAGIRQIAVDPSRSDRLVVATTNGLASSEDAGLLFTREVSALPLRYDVYELAVRGGDEARAWIATDTGVYFRGVSTPPQQAVAAAGDTLAYVTWSAPEYNGSGPPTSYTVTARDHDTSEETTILVRGMYSTDPPPTQVLIRELTNGHTYSFRVVATNTEGNSSSSNETNQVLPTAGAALPEGAAALLAPSGGNVTTGEQQDTNGGDLVSTEVDSQFQGGTSIAEGAPSDTAPEGEAFVGQEVEVLTPESNYFEPMKQIFTIDASQVPLDWETMDFYRSENDGPSQLVEPCLGDGLQATPSPCLSKREQLANGDVQFTVLTVHNTVWRFAAPASVAGPPLDVVKRGLGVGTVRSTPAGLDCGPRCGMMFPKNADVVLTAAPASGSVFAGWTGACAGQGARCSLKMGGARRSMAIFMPRNHVAVTTAAFSPSALTVPQGTTVDWTLLDSTGQTVTETSPLRLFHYGVSSRRRTASHTFPAAGRYPYRSAFHPSTITASVAVPMKSSAPKVALGKSVRLQWSSAALTAPAFEQVEYRYRRSASSGWTAWKNLKPLLTSKTTAAGSFQPTQRGLYQFRARRAKTVSGNVVSGGWSPVHQVEAT